MKAPGEALLEKLWESIFDKGIGGALEPWQQRRVGNVTIELKRREALVLAQTQRDVDAIRRGEKTLLPNGEVVATPGVRVPPQPTTGDSELGIIDIAHIEQVAEANGRADAVRKEFALAKVVLHAEEELRNDSTKPSDEPLSEDWLLRWREYAANVSSDEVQQIWGKILAGEVKCPGRYSLRTLEFVKNVSPAEANLIEKVAPAVVENFIYKDALDSAGISFPDLLAMQELGLVHGVQPPGLKISVYIGQAGHFLRARDRVIHFVSDGPNKEFKLNNLCFLTTVGREVLHLVAYDAGYKMLVALAKVIKSQGFQVKIGRCKEIGGNPYFFDLVAA